MEDLKQYVKIDERKLKRCIAHEHKLGKLAFLGKDASQWMACLSYQKERNELANFLMYRCAGAWNLHGAIDDADVCTAAMAYLKEKLMAVDEVAKVEWGAEIQDVKPRTLRVTLVDGSQIYLESDTANSLMRDVGLFYRLILTKRYGSKWPEETYIKEFQLDDDGSANYYQPFKLFYFYTLLERFDQEKLLDAEEQKVLDVLQQRAACTHTLANMIVVPYGYNQERGSFRGKTHTSNQKIQDDVELSLRDLKEMLADDQFHDAQLQKRLRNPYATMRSLRFLLEHQEELFPPIPYLEDKMREDSLEGILERSERIIKTLSKTTE